MKLPALFLLLICILACTQEPQLVDELPKPPTSDADIVVQPIVTEPESDVSAREELERLLENPAKEFSVDYTFTAVVGGQTQQSTLALYVKGDKVRSDSVSNYLDQNFETRDIQGDKVITCSKQGTWSCFELDLPENATLEEGEIWEGHDIRTSADKIVAGSVVNCFMITLPGEPTTTEACYTPDGIPLYTAVRNQQDVITQEATSYLTSVPDNVFVPPATPGSFEEFLEMINQTMQN